MRREERIVAVLVTWVHAGDIPPAGVVIKGSDVYQGGYRVGTLLRVERWGSTAPVVIYEPGPR